MAIYWGIPSKARPPEPWLSGTFGTSTGRLKLFIGTMTTLTRLGGVLAGLVIGMIGICHDDGTSRRELAYSKMAILDGLINPFLSCILLG